MTRLSFNSLFFSILLGLLTVPSRAFASGALGDYSAAASGLFNNMRTPAALIGGSLVPIGILTAPTLQKDDSKTTRIVKKASIIIAVVSLLSEILAVMYSSIAINKIAEIAQPKTMGVAQLIGEKHELAWLGTNVHFLFGLMGFALVVGAKAVLAGGGLGKITMSWSIAAFLQALTIINRGIALTGDGNDISSRFASNFFMLIVRYGVVVAKSAKGGVCAMAAIAVSTYAFFQTVKTFIQEDEVKQPAP